MPLSNLDDREREIVGECLRAAADGPFFPDWEFHPLFGIERDDLRRILTGWPALDEADSSVVLAINNSFANLLGYPISPADEEAWGDYLSVDRLALLAVFDKWRIAGRTTPRPIL